MEKEKRKLSKGEEKQKNYTKRRKKN